MTEAAFGGAFEWPEWAQDAVERTGPGSIEMHGPNGTACYIETLEGRHACSFDDWIIRGVKGELYPCKPDIFTATYDEVAEQEKVA